MPLLPQTPHALCASLFHRIYAIETVEETDREREREMGSKLLASQCQWLEITLQQNGSIFINQLLSITFEWILFSFRSAVFVRSTICLPGEIHHVLCPMDCNFLFGTYSICSIRCVCSGFTISYRSNFFLSLHSYVVASFHLDLL